MKDIPEEDHPDSFIDLEIFKSKLFSKLEPYLRFQLQKRCYNYPEYIYRV